MVKRVLDIESDEISVSSSPSKRLHTGTTTPARSSSGSTSYTPSSYTIPSDSPSNPFGFNRASQNFELPQPTKFSKHLCLRFQLLTSPRPTTRLHARSKTFLSKLDESKTYDQQGTYRVVQVPLSYTFRHLHALVLFLFNGNPAPPTTPDPGHLFEVQTGVQMCEYEKQPGIIKSGRPWLRLSSVRDPYYSPQSIMDLIASADTPYDMDEEAWRWEGEDEAAMSSVWQDQTDSTRGIIYVRDFRLQRALKCTESAL
ncbi:hypothetical protein BV25DRAFT_1825159 [Artomyces pyxidatus]|uniref:Uncharacterized protein n=1 Tax=Artomyces pyxidatus TaxID=48021 RepID=A0ACB8T3E8_9AGAM|nr:hypothetical protein BV25DRAFT_1825159 [Artomyces pyxidatus]